MNQKDHDHNDEMRTEYDFSQGIRGKHYEAYRAGTNVVFLDPDVARAFPDSASVNQILRLLLQLAKTSVPVETSPSDVLRPAGHRPRGKKRFTTKAGRD
jgi:hypothetical protein